MDGDAETQYSHLAHVFFIPFQSIEKQIFLVHKDHDFPWSVTGEKSFTSAKDCYAFIKQKYRVEDERIFKYLCDEYADEITPLVCELNRFLSLPAAQRQGVDDTPDVGPEI